MNDETYNGWANRETWAFNLHWQNDQWLYDETLEHARYIIEQDALEDPENPPSNRELGEQVVSYWRDALDVAPPTVKHQPTLYMFDHEVGSWWRINSEEVGAAVRESLENES